MNPNTELPEFPRFLVAVNRKFITTRSPQDGQDGLTVFWTEAAAKRVARRTPGAVVVEATPEMFVEAIKTAHEIGVPWLYIGSQIEGGVDFQRVRLALALGHYALDGQHRHRQRPYQEIIQEDDHE